MANPDLTLQEELILLAANATSGRFDQPDLRYALTGAAVAELLLSKRLHLEGNLIRVRQTDSISDEAIDTAFRRFLVTDRPRKATWWIRHFYPTVRQPLDIAASRLVERGILARNERRALWVIHWTDYPLLEPAYVQRLRRRIRDVVLKEAPVEHRLAILIAILYNSQAFDGILDKSEQIDHEHRIAVISASQPIGYAIGKAIAEVRRENEAARERTRQHVIIIEKKRRKRHYPPRPSVPVFPGPPPENDEPW